MLPLAVERTSRDGVDVLFVEGEIDVATAPRLIAALNDAVSEAVRSVIIDLTSVGFMDSTGLGVLVGRLKQIRLNDGSMRLVCAHDRVLKVFVITGLDKVCAFSRRSASPVRITAPVSTLSG